MQIHFDDSQFENRRADGWIRLKLNAIPTIFDHNSSHNSPLRIDPAPIKLLNKVTEQNEVALTCVQEVAEVPIIPQMVILLNTFLVLNKHSISKFKFVY